MNLSSPIEPFLYFVQLAKKNNGLNRCSPNAAHEKQLAERKNEEHNWSKFVLPINLSTTSTCAVFFVMHFSHSPRLLAMQLIWSYRRKENEPKKWMERKRAFADWMNKAAAMKKRMPVEMPADGKIRKWMPDISHQTTSFVFHQQIQPFMTAVFRCRRARYNHNQFQLNEWKASYTRETCAQRVIYLEGIIAKVYETRAKAQQDRRLTNQRANPYTIADTAHMLCNNQMSFVHKRQPFQWQRALCRAKWMPRYCRGNWWKTRPETSLRSE